MWTLVDINYRIRSEEVRPSIIMNLQFFPALGLRQSSTETEFVSVESCGHHGFDFSQVDVYRPLLALARSDVDHWIGNLGEILIQGRGSFLSRNRRILDVQLQSILLLLDNLCLYAQCVAQLQLP